MRKTNTYETFRNNSSGGTGATSQEFVFFEGALRICHSRVKLMGGSQPTEKAMFLVIGKFR